MGYSLSAFSELARVDVIETLLDEPESESLAYRSEDMFSAFAYRNQMRFLSLWVTGSRGL